MGVCEGWTGLLRRLYETPFLLRVVAGRLAWEGREYVWEFGKVRLLSEYELRSSCFHFTILLRDIAEVTGDGKFFFSRAV